MSRLGCYFAGHSYKRSCWVWDATDKHYRLKIFCESCSDTLTIAVDGYLPPPNLRIIREPEPQYLDMEDV